MPSPSLPDPDFQGLSPEAERRSQALSLFYKARRLEKEADDAAALPLYTKALELRPGDPVLVRALTRLNTRLGRTAEALELLEAQARREPENPAALLELTRFLESRAGESPEWKKRAELRARELAERFPAYAPGTNHQVLARLAAQDRAGAQAAVDRALASDSKDPGYWLSLVTPARNAYPLDDPETRPRHLAIVTKGVEKALELAPADPGVRERAADFYAGVEETARAVELYEELTAQHPGNLDARRKLGQCLRIAGREKDAEALFGELVKIDAGDLVARRALISLHEARGDKAGALPHRAEVLRVKGGDAKEYGSLAADMLQAGQAPEAVSLLRRGLFYHPDTAPLLLLLARARTETGDTKGALESMDEAAAAAEKRVPAMLDDKFHYSWARAALEAGDTARAEKLFRESIRRAPKAEPERAAPACNALGYLWINSGERLEEAGELIQTANSLVPEHPPYLDSLGWWLFLKGDTAEAVRVLQKAAALTEDKPDAELLRHLAAALKKAGREPEAAEVLQKIPAAATPAPVPVPSP